MGINWNTEWPDDSETASTDYPQGAPRNESDTETGTPLDELWMKDTAGFHQALLSESGITESGSAETAVSSDYLNAIKTISGKVFSDIESITESDISELAYGVKFFICGYYSDSSSGGGHFIKASGRHDGVIYFDPSRSSEIGTSDYYTDSGSDADCVMRVNYPYITTLMAGAMLSSNDDTNAIQAAIDTGLEVFVSAGTSSHTGLTTNNNGQVIRGAGVGVSILNNIGTNVSSLQIAPDDPNSETDKILGVVVSGIEFRYENDDPSGGSHVELIRAGRCQIKSCYMLNHYRGVTFKGVDESCILSKTDITSNGSNVTATQSGSAGIAILRQQVDGDSSIGVQDPDDSLYYTEPNSVYIDNVNVRANGTSNYGMQYNMTIDACDGLYMNNMHLGFGTLACIRIKAAQENLNLENILANNIFVDPVNGKTSYGIYYEASGLDDNVVDNHMWSNITIGGATISALVVAEDAKRITFDNCSFRNSQNQNIQIQDGRLLEFNACKYTNANQSGGSYAHAEITGGDSMSFNGGLVGGSGAYYIKAGSSATEVTVDGARIDSSITDTAFYLGNSSRSVKVANISETGSSDPVITAASTIEVPAQYDWFRVSAGDDIDTISVDNSTGNAQWDGREITLFATGAFTVNNGTGNITLPNGDWSATANQILKLIHRNGTWYEVSRT
jgi:hypothetical protein